MLKDTLLAIALIASISGCASDPASADGPKPEPPAENSAPAANPAPNAAINPAPAVDWNAEMTRIAEAYESWGRVDEMPAESPFLCRIPSPGRPADVRMSEADDASGHARKLYYLHASDKAQYLQLGYGDDVRDALEDRVGPLPGYLYEPPYIVGEAPSPLPVGFTVVKESYTALPGEAPTCPADLGEIQLDGFPRAPEPWHDVTLDSGETFHTGDAAGLYIVTKVSLDEDAPGTDAGWVYGTVSPDGTVQSGVLENCAGCHTGAKHERLIGFWDRYR